tara:strand:+ start:34712 stop:35044 length:333 start_codon:yes stop_codon:yes gene_type:complete
MNKQPKLVDPSIKYIVHKSLQACNKVKNNHTNIVFNCSMFIGLVSLIGFILYMKYKGKLTPEQKAEKKEKDKVFIFTKLKQMEMIRKKENNDLITNLPFTDSIFSSNFIK